MPRRPLHLCEVCGSPVYGEETVCPPCLRELDRILRAADPRQPDDEDDEFGFGIETDREGWASSEEDWQTSAVG